MLQSPAVALVPNAWVIDSSAFGESLRRDRIRAFCVPPRNWHFSARFNCGYQPRHTSPKRKRVSALFYHFGGSDDLTRS